MSEQQTKPATNKTKKDYPHDRDRSFKKRDIAIYKPNKKKNGAAAQFKISNQRDCMFLEVANQIREMDDANPYDWSNKIILKLGEADLCKMLAYFDLDKPSAELSLFHQSPDGTNKGLKIAYQEYNGRPQYYFSVTHQKGKGQPPNKVGFPVGLDELQYLRIGFRKVLELILNWD